MVMTMYFLLNARQDHCASVVLPDAKSLPNAPKILEERIICTACAACTGA